RCIVRHARLMLRLGDGLIVVFLFDFAPSLTRDSWPDKTINQVSHERDGQHDGQDSGPQSEKKPDEDRRDDHLGEGSRRTQVEFFKVGNLTSTDNKREENQQKAGKEIAPFPGGKISSVRRHQKQRQGAANPRRGRYGKAKKFFPTACPGGRGEAIKTSQPQ